MIINLKFYRAVCPFCGVENIVLRPEEDVAEEYRYHSCEHLDELNISKHRMEFTAWWEKESPPDKNTRYKVVGKEVEV